MRHQCFPDWGQGREDKTERRKWRREKRKLSQCLLLHDWVTKWACTPSKEGRKAWMRCLQDMSRRRHVVSCWGPTQEGLVLYLSDLGDANVAELVWLKALQFIYVRAGSMAKLNLSKCAQSHSICIFCIRRKGIVDFRSRKRNLWKYLRVSGQRASLSSNPMSLCGTCSQESITSIPWEPFRKHITGHHLSAFYFKTSGIGPSALHS